jgi:drug/metabolite transporter (DMT)-like permease
MSIPKNTKLAGIGLMVLGVSLFSINDGLGKWVLASYAVGQMLLIRGLTALLLLSPFLWREGAGSFAAMPRPGMQILRALLSAAEVTMFFVAVKYLPLADTMTFYLAGPIYVTALSALFLGERVGWRRWSAVLVGFIGVVITMRPSAAMFTGPALIAFLGSLAYAALLVTTRSLRGTSDMVLATMQIGAVVVFAAMAAPLSWTPLERTDLLMLALMGLLSVCALLCVNRSLKLAPASVVVPYQYTMIIWGIFLGYVGFGEIPDAAMLIGAAIIVAAGLYIFMREQALSRREQPFTPPS